METFFHEQIKTFWMHVIEQLDAEDETGEAVSGVIKEICDLMGFRYSFIYYADHKGIFSLDSNFSEYAQAGELPSEIEFHEKIQEKILFITEEQAKNTKEQVFLELFQSKQVLLLPITKEDETIALIGMMGAKADEKIGEYSESFMYSIMVVIVNHVRLMLYQRDILRTQTALASIVDNMGVDIYVNDFLTHEILYVNSSMAAPYGGVEAMQGRICWQALYDDKEAQCEYCPQFKLTDHKGNPTKIYSWNYQRPFDGAWFRVLSGAFEWVDGRTAHIVSSIDITEDKSNEEIVSLLADYDTLTKLPNRRKLLADCQQLITMGEPFFVLFFDLDKFKQVNDICGHRAGDELLRKVGAFLQSDEQTKERSYRYGGDEFVLLCKECDISEVLKVAAFLVERFSQAWQLETCETVCNASVGIAGFSGGVQSELTLIAKADEAMYQSKGSSQEKIHIYDKGRICTPDKYVLS